MNFLDKLERKWGRYAIKNLMLYIVLGNAFIFLFTNLGLASTNQFVFYLPAVLQGEVWRLLTFLLIPQTNDFIWFIFATMLYYFVGNALEQVWGSFKFNLYYFTGALGTLLITSIFSLMIPIFPLYATSHYINLSLFLGFATLFPNMQFRLYFFIPIKAKYLGILYFFLLAVDIVRGGIFAALLILISLINYLLFFGVPALKFYSRKRKNPSYQKASYKNIPKGTKPPVKVAFHQCHVCKKTELDDPNLEFRYCSSCDGNYEYCMEHLKNHEHIKE